MSHLNIKCGDVVRVKYFGMIGTVWYVNQEVVSIENDIYPALTIPLSWVKVFKK